MSTDINVILGLLDRLERKRKGIIILECDCSNGYNFILTEEKNKFFFPNKINFVKFYFDIFSQTIDVHCYFSHRALNKHYYIHIPNNHNIDSEVVDMLDSIRFDSIIHKNDVISKVFDLLKTNAFTVEAKRRILLRTKVTLTSDKHKVIDHGQFEIRGSI